MLRVKEVFRTLQGEGVHAGRPAVFVRLAGCNIWSGREQDRERDSARGVCARFCDTDFVGGTAHTAESLFRLIEKSGADESVFVVMTGGEPLLQLRTPEGVELLRMLAEHGIDVHVETNGTVEIPDSMLFYIHWVAVAPKPPSTLRLTCAHEIKVVHPSCNVDGAIEEWRHRFGWACPVFIMPEDGPSVASNTASAVRFVQQSAGSYGGMVRLGVQLHKMIGVP